MENLESRGASSTCSLILGEALTIRNPPKEIVDIIKEEFKLKNPSYWQAVKRNPGARYFLSEYIPYYAICNTTGDITLGRGCADRVKEMFALCERDFELEDRRVSRPAKIVSSIELREYQLGVIGEIARRAHGLVRLGTGFGKTLIAVQLAVELGQRTLIIVPKLDILTQFVYEIERWTGTTAGVIQGKRTDVRDITVATIQTLQKRISGNAFSRSEREQFGCVIVDEAHLSVPQKSRACVQSFPARYLYGLTATDRRSDGQGDAIRWIYGDKLVDRELPRETPRVEIVPYDGKIWMDEYHQMIEAQVNDPKRNALIAEKVKREVDKGRRVLVLTKRVAHYEQLEEELIRCGVHEDTVFALSSTGDKNARKEIVLELRSGDRPFCVLLGTYSLLGVGFDCPSLDTVVFAGDLKSDVLSTQAIGRCLRIFEGKQTPKVIDIRDTNNYVLNHQAKLRKQLYTDNGWEIDEPTSATPFS